MQTFSVQNLFLDEERGLLFAWSTNTGCTVHMVKDVD